MGRRGWGRPHGEVEATVQAGTGQPATRPRDGPRGKGAGALSRAMEESDDGFQRSSLKPLQMG